MPVPVSPSIPASFTDLARRVSNWGRWGDDDQLGTLNLIDPAARLRGVASVRDGRAFPLGLPMSEAEGIQAGFIKGRVNPTRSMIYVNNPLSEDPDWIASSEDVVTFATQCATHWDGLAHVSYGSGPDGPKLYNGFPAASVTDAGTTKLGVHLIRSLVSRGLLLDVARAKGLEILEPGYPITPDDLDAACALGGLEVAPGDVVLVRTGQTAHLALPGRPGLAGAAPHRDLVAYTWPTPGLTLATTEWFHDRDVAAVATDTMVLEVYPCEDKDLYLPVHLIHLVEMGMTQGQNWFLDELADACAADGRYQFLLDATPLPFTDALGSPVNPVALR
ncbi:MAG TPA: cyclase family protein [Acidimicrobiales bacterium]|nr:cyclase family protein [Acidimicrobiales bacterium]